MFPPTNRTAGLAALLDAAAEVGVTAHLERDRSRGGWKPCGRAQFQGSKKKARLAKRRPKSDRWR